MSPASRQPAQTTAQLRAELVEARSDKVRTQDADLPAQS
jgi:hypothetical protein